MGQVSRETIEAFKALDSISLKAERIIFQSWKDFFDLKMYANLGIHGLEEKRILRGHTKIMAMLDDANFQSNPMPSLLAGNPYHFDKEIPHVNKLFHAYLQQTHFYCDRVIAGWTDKELKWTERNAEIALKKWKKARDRLDPGRRDMWDRRMKAWWVRKNDRLKMYSASQS